MAPGHAVARQHDVVVAAAADGRDFLGEHVQAAEVGLRRGVDDDEATLAGLPDLQLLEPGDPGLDVVVGVHGAQPTASAAARVYRHCRSGNVSRPWTRS